MRTIASTCVGPATASSAMTRMKFGIFSFGASASTSPTLCFSCFSFSLSIRRCRRMRFRSYISVPIVHERCPIEFRQSAASLLVSTELWQKRKPADPFGMHQRQRVWQLHFSEGSYCRRHFDVSQCFRIFNAAELSRDISKHNAKRYCLSCDAECVQIFDGHTLYCKLLFSLCPTIPCPERRNPEGGG